MAPRSLLHSHLNAAQSTAGTKVNSEAASRSAGNNNRLQTAAAGAHRGGKSMGDSIDSLNRAANARSMGQEGSREAVNRDLHRAVAEIRKPGRLPKRTSTESNTFSRLPLVELKRNQKETKDRQERQPHSTYDVESSPEKARKRIKANGTPALHTARSRQSINARALIASQLGQEPVEDELSSPPRKSVGPDTLVTLDPGVEEGLGSGVERFQNESPELVDSADSHTGVSNLGGATGRIEEEEEGDDATAGAEIGRNEKEARLAAEFDATGGQGVGDIGTEEEDQMLHPQEKKRGPGRPRKNNKVVKGQQSRRQAEDGAREQDTVTKSPRRSPRKKKQASSHPQSSLKRKPTSRRSGFEATSVGDITGSVEEEKESTPPSGQRETSYSRPGRAVLLAVDEVLFPENEEESDGPSEPEIASTMAGSRGSPDGHGGDATKRNAQSSEYIDAGHEGSEGEEDEEDEEIDEHEQYKSRHIPKRSQPEDSSNKANSGRPRTPSRTASAPMPAVSVQDSRRLFGEWQRLRSIVHVADGYLRKFDTDDSNDGSVNNIVKRCQRCEEKCAVLRKEIETELEEPDDESMQELESTLVALMPSLSKLCDNSSISTDRTSAVFNLLFPTLVKLLDAIVCFYETLDVELYGEPQLSLDHLHVIIKWTQSVHELGMSARTNLPSNPNDPVKRAVHKEIIMPLESMTDSLSGRHSSLQAQQQEFAQREHEKRRRDAKLREEETIRRRKEHHKRLVHKWNSLHLVRQSVIPNYLLVCDSATKRHLDYPSDKVDVFTDDTAYLADRVFAPRVGPSPAAIQRVKEQGPWPKEHVHALVWGLQHFAGVAVLEDTIREYCGRGGPLARYNVSEIAVKAAEWRKRLVRLRSKEGKEIETWIKQIPVWTEPHVLDEEEHRREDDEDSEALEDD